MDKGRYIATAGSDLSLEGSHIYWLEGEQYTADVNEYGEMELQSENGASYFTKEGADALKDDFCFQKI